METEVLSSMYAFIANGGLKEDCRHVTDEETSKAFDSIASQVRMIKQSGQTLDMINP
jgi:hypothetical protein